MKAINGVAGAGVVSLENALANIVAHGVIALLGVRIGAVFLIGSDVWRAVLAN